MNVGRCHKALVDHKDNQRNVDENFASGGGCMVMLAYIIVYLPIDLNNILRLTKQKQNKAARHGFFRVSCAV